MSPQDNTFWLFSWLFIVVMALWIMIPYLRGKRDLICFLNIFLGGSIVFLGMSGIAWSQLEHRSVYTSEDYNLLYVGTVVFYLMLLVSYSLVKWPRRLAGRYFRKWPQPTFMTYFTLAIVCIVISALALLQIPIPFVAQMTFALAGHMGPFAITFALLAFRRDSFNPLMLSLLTLTIAAELLLSLSFGGGRRMAFSALAAFPICLYWQWLRYKKPYVVLPICLAIGLLLIGFNNGLQVVRHRTSDHHGLGRAVETLRLIATGAFNVSSTDLAQTAQDGAEVSLFTIHHFASRNAKYDGQLLFGPYFILVNPIPRVFWPEKPESFGYTLPMDVGKAEGLGGYGSISWGVPLVAQGYHDGGLWVVALYGLVLGLVLRWFDELIVRQPDNPFLLGFFAAISANLAGLARGTMDAMVIPMIGAALAALLLIVLARMFFGSGHVYPRTDHVLDFPKGAWWARQRIAGPSVRA